MLLSRIVSKYLDSICYFPASLLYALFLVPHAPPRGKTHKSFHAYKRAFPRQTVHSCNGLPVLTTSSNQRQTMNVVSRLIVSLQNIKNPLQWISEWTTRVHDFDFFKKYGTFICLLFTFMSHFISHYLWTKTSLPLCLWYRVTWVSARLH